MPTKRSKMSRVELLSAEEGNGQAMSNSTPFGGTSGITKPRGTAPMRSAAGSNEYLCALERNQNGKYTVRVRAFFGAGGGEVNGGSSAQTREGGWILPVYFLASSFNAAMKKLQESLQLLQRNEERLRFWSVERTDDPNLAGELLQEFGLWLDRRRDFPRKIAELGVRRERAISASMLAPVRRVLADSLAQERPTGRSALAGD